MPVLPCTDLKLSVAHYHDALRFDGGWQWLWGEPPTHAGLSRDSVRLMLHGSPAAAAKARGLTCYFYVRSVEALHAEHRRSGAKVLGPVEEKPYGTIEYAVEYPDGMVLIFAEAPD